MKKKDLEFSKTKYKLRQMQINGKESVIWKLSKSQLDYVHDLGYRTEEFLYEVYTRSFQNISSIRNSKIRDLHHANKQRKRTIVQKLTGKDIKEYREMGIKFRPIKHKIYLKA